MSQPYIGEIRMFGGNFPPSGWAFCDGQLLQIADNDTLYNLIGTTYGGDGQSTFGLPDMRGRVPAHQGSSGGQTYAIGLPGGAETVTLSAGQLPQHTHPLISTTTAAPLDKPGAGTILADMGPAGLTTIFAYKPYDGANQVSLNAASVSFTGGNQPHENIQPYLAVNFIISLYGIYPTQS
jgi:microcystin-dependent protein